MNKRKSNLVVEPRKEPKQKRSRQTYQVILQGAMRLIRRNGLEKLSTNKVAEESGVSIGSLYQYFPSKQAIVAALIDQVFEAEYQKLKSAFEDMSPQIGARQVIKNIFAFYFRNEDEELAYRRALVHSVALVDKTTEALKFHRSVGELVIHFMAQHYPPPGGFPHLPTTTFFVQYLMRSVALSAVDQDIQTVDKDFLMGELAETLLNFLKVPQEYRGVLA